MIAKGASVVLALTALSSAVPILEKLHFNNDKIIRDFDKISYEYPELASGYFEGDMVLTKAQMKDIYNANTQRNGLLGPSGRWPNNTIVYHIIEDDFEPYDIILIKEALEDIENKTCLKFRLREGDEHAVTIQGNKRGCYSSVGFKPDKDEEEDDDDDNHISQVLNLEKGCRKHGTILHEILHTIGFYHMQSTYDRDEYVKIAYENILPGTEHNFAKYSMDTVTSFDVTYDYGSIMHYPEKAFTKNGNKTIIPLQDNVKIGQRVELSEKDVLKINKMYCENVTEENEESLGD